MKTERVIRLFLAVLVLFFVAASKAIGEGEWTPDNVEIVPQNPTSADVVDITFSGNWPDSCIPSSFPIEVTGNDIYFNVISDLNDVCTQVPTPWQETRSVEPLSPGVYGVYASLDRGPWTLVTEFYVAETNTYVFIPEQSTVVEDGGYGGWYNTYPIEGQFILTINLDANSASFDQVDAALNRIVFGGYGQDLNDLFDMTELVGTVVSDTEIDFDTNDPLLGGKVVHLDLTLADDSAQLTGGFCEPWPDGFCFDMNAVARKKIVSNEVSWISGESSPPDWKVEPNYASTSDIIHFFGPTAVFGNSCSATVSVGGTPTLTIDPVNKTIELWFQPPPPYMCPQVYDPVCGLEGSFGPLEPGQWLFFGNDPNATFSIPFQVDSTIDSNSTVDNGIKYYMRTDKSIYKLDEQVEMSYRVTNLTPNSVDIGYILNCEDAWTHFAITDDGDTDIWQFFRINPPCGYIMFSLDPYESRECQMVWDMTNDNGTLEPDDDFPVGSGLYNIAGELELGGGYQRVPVSVTIEIIPVVYVDADATGAGDGSSWADAYIYLQHALWEANSIGGPVEIRVAQGTYKPNEGVLYVPEFDERELTFQLINDVTIKGGYAGYGEPDPDARDIELYETILSGDLAGDDADVKDSCDLLTEPGRAENSYHVVTSRSNDASAVLDGVTIIGGNANANGGWDDHGDHGGGMYINRGSATLRDCTFAGNSAGSGGGMFIWAADPKVTGCTFRANAAERHAGGLVVAEPYLKSVTNCTFSANFAGWSGGAVWNWDAHPTYVNCLFTGNRAGENGGAMRNSDSSWYTLVNCTLSDNVAGQRGGAIDSDEWPILVNCIFWANRDSSGMGESAHVRGHYQQPSFNYCCVQGWTGALGGNGNIDADPLFVDPCDDDYHLKSEGWRWSKYLVHGSHWWCDYVTSPCIDAGNPGSPLGDELLTIPDDLNHDWGENIRINMGAYGGTAEAGMPPYDWALLADLNNDGTVGYEDLAGQIEDWLTIANEKPGDLNRDGVVNAADFALLAQDWLAKTSWYPPIVLEIYSDGWGTLLDTITMRQERDITISVDEENPYYDPPQYYIYASRESYSTELYYCQKGDTINVDLDEIVPNKFNAVIFMNAGFFADDYLENTDVTVLDGDTPGSTIVAQFQTDQQGRFAIDPLLPGTYYFEFNVFGDEPEEHSEQVGIQSQYQDFNFYYHVQMDKPNIYLYPEETIELDVDIIFPHGGQVTTSIPDYGDGWHVTVEPNGIIDGQYEFLFYESLQPDYGQYETGWVVAQGQLESFFRNNMAQTGFNQKEIDGFIEYWIPLLTEHPYYAVYPQYKDELEEMARLRFSTQPTSLIRLIYSVRGLNTDNLSLQEPVIPPFSREGFTVVEWGVILK